QDPTGLTHIGARHYDPTQGRFISVDPLVNPDNPQTLNAYAYANNNPTTYTDPTGLAFLEGNGGAYGEGKKTLPGSRKTTTGTPLVIPVKGTPRSAGSPGGSTPKAGGGGSASKGYACGKYGTCGGEAKPEAEACGSWNGWCSSQTGGVDAHREWLNEISGVADFTRCGDGQWQGCLLFAAMFIPGGPVAKYSAKAALFLRTAWLRKLGKACSFSGDTEVLMADGATKPIEDITVGDTVMATDPETGEEGPREVTHLWIHDDHLVNLTVASGNLTTTEDHPFWNHTDQQWQRADALDPGDRLLAATGETPPVTGVDWTTTRHDTAYNLTVADIHTYYVLAGNTPVLVHNTGGCPISGFKNGISAGEVDDINRSFGGEFLLNGSFDNTMINASRYNSFWDKSAVVIRDIAGGHMYNNGNKRTAQAVVEQLMQRNNVVSGPTSAGLRSVIDRVGKGQLSSVEDISAALRGY
ncbi:polymorphic toxin-type HINT domain-containing protein, partial [Micromonospora sp. LOL_023]|uniref:polymorphic toxin-type HINT domain-containing protein n=1 Tax=Micromonospora sp. LOL_023 TaxID=3345418 RepID=UPI003A88D779